eukprot:48668-Karenia_brevis.AAC.1
MSDDEETGAAALSASSSQQQFTSNTAVSEQPVEPPSGDAPTDSERVAQDAAPSSTVQPVVADRESDRMDEDDA